MTWTTEAVVHASRKEPPYLKKIVIDHLEPRKVLVKTDYAAINPVDVKLHALSLLGREMHTLKDFAGEVVAVGSDVASKVQVGEKVWGSILRAGKVSYVGTYTLVDYDADILAPLPANLTSEQASGLGVVYGTAFEMLEYAQAFHKLGPSSHVLVLGGATTVGSYVSQLAKKYFHIGRVTATASGKSAEYAKSFGADDVIDYTKGHLSAQFVDYVKQQGHQFDAVLDCVGGYDAIAVYPEILKPASEGSTYITVMGDAGPAKTYAGTMLGALAAMPRVLFRHCFGKYLGINYRIFLTTKGDWVKSADTFFSMPGAKVPIDSVYPLSELKTAWDKVDSARARGKVILKF